MPVAWQEVAAMASIWDNVPGFSPPNFLVPNIAKVSQIGQAQ